MRDATTFASSQLRVNERIVGHLQFLVLDDREIGDVLRDILGFGRRTGDITIWPNQPISIAAVRRAKFGIENFVESCQELRNCLPWC